MTDGDPSLVLMLLEQQKLMLEREDQLREDAKAEKDELVQQMDSKMKKLREELKPAPPPEVLSEQRLVALQQRLEALHMAKLLGDDELYSLEDIVADFVEHRQSSMGVVTLEAIATNDVVGKMLKLVALSESIVGDGAFARQARRKFL